MLFNDATSPVQLPTPWAMQLFWFPFEQHLWFIATSLQVDHLQCKWLSQSSSPNAPPPRPQFTVQMFPLNPEAVITCVRAGRQRVLVLKDSKPRVANWDWEGSILPLQLFPIGAKVTHVKMHRKDILDMDLNTFSRVMLFLKVSEASQSQSVLPASLKTVTKQEASHYIVPPLEERTSNFNAHYNHLGSS